jgi:hypothetical protein
MDFKILSRFIMALGLAALVAGVAMFLYWGSTASQAQRANNELSSKNLGDAVRRGGHFSEEFVNESTRNKNVVSMAEKNKTTAIFAVLTGAVLLFLGVALSLSVRLPPPA